MKRNSLLIFLLISSLFAKKFVAVLEMDPIGLTEEEGRILTQRLTSEIINADIYSVVERTNIEKILKEQKFQHSGCTDSECAVEIGQLVNANYIVIGSASKFGATYTIDVRMIDVALGSAVSTAVYNHKGELDDLITEGIISVARELSGLKYKVKKKISSGTLNIKSNPDSADIFINNIYYNKTPKNLNNFPIGKYTIQIKLDGYKEAVHTIKVTKNKTTDIITSLAVDYKGYLDLMVFPDSAFIYIDNMKQVNKESYTLSPGKHKISIQAPFFENISQYVTIYNESHINMDFVLKRKNPIKTKKLAWIFPGLGHLYADNEKRGKLLLSLGIAGITNTFIMYNKSTDYSNKYNNANQKYLNAVSVDDIIDNDNLRKYYLEQKNQFAINYSISGAITLGIWIWNTFDINNSIPKNIMMNNKVNIGVNQNGQLEANFAL